ncbi:MAG: permease prefix domain 1-containing protein [Faecousia sp.]
MRKKLIAYVNDLFAQAPKNPQARDLHDEILLNTLDRFDEEVAAGQPEQAAFDAAVAGIGDIDELLEPLGANKSDVIFRRVIAIALYVCCVIPVILTEAFGGVAETVGICLMFVLAALATYLLLSANVTAKTKKRKRLRALGIALYVVCVTPTILFDGLLGGKAGEAVGVSLMFLIAAAATGLVVYSANRTVKKTPARTAAVQKETEEKTTSKLSSILAPIYWICVVGVFCALGVFWGWPFAWLVFPMAGAVADIIRGAVLMFQKQPGGAKKLTVGISWAVITALYLILTVRTGAWYATWLLFPMGAALGGVINGIFEL